MDCEVKTLVNSPARYELDDLEDWLAETSPVILRRSRPAIVSSDTNPFLEFAKAQGFKPSIDVEKRLAGMSYMAGGDASVHGTQLSVSASLMRSGMIVDDAVALILEATKGAAAGYGERWNWKREERAIRKMCADWLVKHPAAPERKEAKAADLAKARPIEIFWHGTEYNRAARSWLVKELIPERGAGLASGQWGTAKTFAMLDLAASIMTGTPFAGREIDRRGGVLFFAAEGANEIPIRLKAVVEQKLKPAAMAASAAGEPLDADLERLPFAWVEECPSLKDAASFEKLVSIAIAAADQIKEQFKLPLALIVIDTLSASADFEDANAAAEGQRIMNRLADLGRRTDAFVMAVDHFGKDVATGTRGTTAKEGAADVVLALLAERAVNGTVTNTRMAVRKLRGGLQGIETPFNLTVVDAGGDETTCVIDWKPSKAKGTTIKEKWTKSLKVFRASVTTAILDHGTMIHPFGSEGPLVRAAGLNKVRSEFMAAYPAENAGAKRQAFGRAVALARERDLICSREIDGVDQVWIVDAQNG
jgi:AAA domain